MMLSEKLRQWKVNLLPRTSAEYVLTLRADVNCFADAAEALEWENAKLRELVLVMYWHYHRGSCGCNHCLMHNDGMRVEISDIEFCEEMYELMQECGIEVDG